MRYVVGYDGSREAAAALEYAVARARGDGEVIAVFAAPPAPDLDLAMAAPGFVPGPVPETMARMPTRVRERDLLPPLPAALAHDGTIQQAVVTDRPAAA